MNFSTTDSVIGRQRCRQWTPLSTQQLRLRHLYQITAYNLKAEGQDSFYYTLHLTPMSAPFFTSEILESVNPNWAEIDVQSLTHGAATTFVLRIWQKRDNGIDSIVITWGINLSGLVYLGNKRSDIQPTLFVENSVIFHMRGGYFTSYNVLRTDLQKPLPFIDYLNLTSYEDAVKVYRNSSLHFTSSEVKRSYNLKKLQRLHSLQIANKNKSFDCKVLRDKINSKCALCLASNTDVLQNEEVAATTTNQESNIRYAPQLLTMNSLNRMLQEKPTKFQRQEIVRVSKEIEISKFKTKLLSQERDRKKALIRRLKQKHIELCDSNEERNSLLMENYHRLNKDSERLREWKKVSLQYREIHMNTCMQLQHRRRQLMQQLLFIYPIRQIQEHYFVINDIYLPNSDILDSADSNLSVALGYITHILTMCSSFLQVPLRYPLSHMGSRSHITDQISVSLNNRDRDFPLFTKGKDRVQFDYAVYLLNKNIAQLRWFCSLHTPELKATLSNLYSLLKGKERSSLPVLNSEKQVKQPNTVLESNSLSVLLNYGSSSNITDPILDSLRHECQMERNSSPPSKSIKKPSAKPVRMSSGPSLSEILAIPEAFLNRQISPDSFKNYMSSRCYNTERVSRDVGETSGISKFNKPQQNCDIHAVTSYAGENIEQGTDLLQFNVNMNAEESRGIEIKPEGSILRQNDFDKNDIGKKQQRRISRSVGSYTDDERIADLQNCLEMGSDPLISITTETVAKETEESAKLPSSLEGGQQEFLQKWLNSGPAVACSDENLYPDEVPESSPISNNNPLTARVDALLHTTSFNLVKPKL